MPILEKAIGIRGGCPCRRRALRGIGRRRLVAGEVTGPTYGAHELDFDALMCHPLPIADSYRDLGVSRTRRLWGQRRLETNLSADRVTIVVNWTLDDFVFLPFDVHLFPQFFSFELDVYVDWRCEKIGHGDRWSIINGGPEAKCRVTRSRAHIDL